jgi:transposase InsO family protein
MRLDGLAVGRRRVARLMRLAGLQGRSARLYRQSKVARRAFYAGVPYREGSAAHAGVGPGAGGRPHLGYRGIEYAALEFRDQISRLGMLQNMNRAGKMNDNAHMESFFHSMKTQELYGKTFTDDQQLRQTLSNYISFYNQQRVHSSLRYLPPAAYEKQQVQQACVN